MVSNARPQPTRMCVACRTTRPKRELRRIVRTPDGRVVVDDTGRVAGRGAYVCRDGDCATTAISKGVLSRALEAPLPDELRTRLAVEATNARLNEGGERGEE